MSRINLVMIGASAGGLPALSQLIAGLPANLDAAVLVVMHVGVHPSVLPDLLARSGVLPTRHADDGEPIAPGHVYVAPPDRHLLVEDGRLRLNGGPKEHHTRPAIDPLFRSAALAATGGLIGIVLSGRLDDGTAGLQAVKAAGGIAIVQDPREAAEPSMPNSALRHVAVDHCVPVDGMAELVVEVLRASRGVEPVGAPGTTSSEHQVFLGRGASMDTLQEIAMPSGLVCPDCRGTLWRVTEAAPPRYRCHAGHGFTLRTLQDAQAEAAEEALWAAVAALQEKQLLVTEMATLARSSGDERGATEYEADALDLLRQTEQLRRLVQEVGRHGETAVRTWEPAAARLDG